jgi:hypothetical protein
MKGSGTKETESAGVYPPFPDLIETQITKMFKICTETRSSGKN